MFDRVREKGQGKGQGQGKCLENNRDKILQTVRQRILGC